MSAEVRNLLATAASTQDGINVRPYFLQSTKAGDGFVRRDATNYPNPFGGIVTWQVVVVLPQDMASAEKYIDTKTAALVEAVAEHMVVRSVTPVQMTFDTAQIPCLVIEGNREE